MFGTRAKVGLTSSSLPQGMIDNLQHEEELIAALTLNAATLSWVLIASRSFFHSIGTISTILHICRHLLDLEEVSQCEVTALN